jgi:hypothetical protein
MNFKMCGGLFSFCFLHETVFGNGQVAITHNKAGYEGFIRKRHEKDSWSKGRNIEYGGEAEADFMPEAEYQEQL